MKTLSISALEARAVPAGHLVRTHHRGASRLFLTLSESGVPMRGRPMLLLNPIPGDPLYPVPRVVQVPTSKMVVGMGSDFTMDLSEEIARDQRGDTDRPLGCLLLAGTTLTMVAGFGDDPNDLSPIYVDMATGEMHAQRPQSSIQLDGWKLLLHSSEPTVPPVIVATWKCVPA